MHTNLKSNSVRVILPGCANKIETSSLQLTVDCSKSSDVPGNGEN